MASVVYSIECPHCGRSAIKYYDDKMDVEYICCLRCDQQGIKSIENETDESIEYKEEHETIWLIKQS